MDYNRMLTFALALFQIRIRTLSIRTTQFALSQIDSHFMFVPS